jgi:hypothetical protein
MLISLLVAVVVISLVWYLLTLLPIPQPFRNIVTIIFILIIIIWLLGFAGVFPGYGPGWHSGRLP